MHSDLVGGCSSVHGFGVLYCGGECQLDVGIKHAFTASFDGLTIKNIEMLLIDDGWLGLTWHYP